MQRILLSVLLIVSPVVFAQCDLIKKSDGINQLLAIADTCPANVFQFRELIKSQGLQLQSTMVANEGFHHPQNGSFSLFEMVVGHSKIIGKINQGEFFFGHFTTISDSGYLTLDQTPRQNALMIEAFAWDAQNKVFNFYELRGDGKQGKWFYRGDSTDIYADNKMLHRQIDSSHPQFGTRLRCSGCHMAGGPIMKELSSPHNDWWSEKRKLDFGDRTPDIALKEIMKNLIPADQLEKSVITGLKKLNRENYSLSFQELLRPLFCPMELNLASDKYENGAQRKTIRIPAEFFVDSRLVKPKNQTIDVSREQYEKILQEVSSHFPDTELKDADHAWLTPIKAKSDQMAVNELLKQKVIDKKFVFDVLSIDMTNPIFSHTRCDLLRLLPEKSSPNWKNIFIENLKRSDKVGAKELYDDMTDVEKTPEYYQRKAQIYLSKCKVNFHTQNNLKGLYLLLLQRRKEVRTSEISANPLGQILEPGFRVIFPDIIADIPAQKLNKECLLEKV